jgi:hypothetical protein
MGPVTASSRRPRRKTSAAVVLSIVVHGALLYVLARVTILTPRRPERLAEAPSTTLTLPPAPEPRAAPVPDEPTPQPQPAPALQPTPPAEPPRPAPLLITATPERVPEAMQVEPRPAPRAMAPAPSAPPPPPPPPPPREEPRVSFAGLDASPASRIVYVVDGSAAMIPTLPFVKDELARSVARLSPTQVFQVIVFRSPPMVDDRPTAPALESFAPAGTFVPATPANKVRLGAWIEEARPAGGSAPLVGLRAAMGQSPDLVFLMTCSIKRTGGDWGDGRDAILAELDRLNPVNTWTHQRPAVIKAVQFLDDDPTGILPAIASSHGDGPGSYRVLRLKELSPAR